MDSSYFFIPEPLRLDPNIPYFMILNEKNNCKFEALQRSKCCLELAILCMCNSKYQQLNNTNSTWLLLYQDRNYGAESQTAQKLSIKILFNLHQLLRLMTKNKIYLQVYSFLQCQFKNFLKISCNAFTLYLFLAFFSPV